MVVLVAGARSKDPAKVLAGGFVVYAPAAGGALTRMTDLASLTALEVDQAWGYNVLAWIEGGAADAAIGSA